MLALLRSFSWRELRHHPWRNAAAVVAVMLGVALAFSVQLINASALDEFAGAVRSVNGQPDLELRAAQGGFDERLFERIATHPQVALASPVLESQVQLLGPAGKRMPMRVLGVDSLALPEIAPALSPRTAKGVDRLAQFAPGRIFLNAAASSSAGQDAATIQVQAGTRTFTLQVAGSVSAGGSALRSGSACTIR